MDVDGAAIDLHQPPGRRELPSLLRDRRLFPHEGPGRDRDQNADDSEHAHPYRPHPRLPILINYLHNDFL